MNKHEEEMIKTDLMERLMLEYLESHKVTDLLKIVMVNIEQSEKNKDAKNSRY